MPRGTVTTISNAATRPPCVGRRAAGRPGGTLLSLELAVDRSEATVVLTGELDRGGVDPFERAVRALRSTGVESIVVDLRGLDVLQPAGLALLVSLRNDAKRTALRLELVPGPPAVQRLFALTATRRLFTWRS